MDFEKYLTEQMGKLDETVKEAKAEATSTGFDDDRTWYPDRGADGNGTHVVRFLPQMPLEDEKPPYVSNFYHRIERKNRVFWDLCPTAIGLTCDICAATKPYWKAPDNSPEKEIAYTFYRKKQYVSNVYIEHDSVHPENTGKVKLWKFGVTVFNKVMAAMESNEEIGVTGINPFNLLYGASFIVKVTTKDKRANYDASTFKTPEAFLKRDMAKIQAVMGMVYDLDEFTSPSRFKDGAVLLANLGKFLQDAEAPDIFEQLIGGGVPTAGKESGEQGSGLQAWLNEQKGEDNTPREVSFDGNTTTPAAEETTVSAPAAEEKSFGEEMANEQAASVKETPPASTPEDEDPDAEFFRKLKESKK